MERGSDRVGTDGKLSAVSEGQKEPLEGFSGKVHRENQEVPTLATMQMVIEVEAEEIQ